MNRFPRFQNPDDLIEKIGFHIFADVTRLTDGAIDAAEIAAGCNLDKGDFADRTGVEIDTLQSFEILRRIPVKNSPAGPRRQTVFVIGLEQFLIKARRIAGIGTSNPTYCEPVIPMSRSGR